MKQEATTQKVIKVLRHIQTSCGHSDANDIGDRTVPLDDLDGFDSLLLPVATTLLAQELDIVIPNKRNLFVSRDGKRRLSVKEIADGISRLVEEKE